MHGSIVHFGLDRPAQGGHQHAAANLRAVSPTLYFNVPRGYDVLLPLLEADEVLARGPGTRLLKPSLVVPRVASADTSAHRFEFDQSHS